MIRGINSLGIAKSHKCPHCGKYPFKETEISVQEEVEIVMFPGGELKYE